MSNDNRRKLRTRELGPAVELLLKASADRGEITLGVVADPHGYLVASFGDEATAHVLAENAAMWASDGPGAEAAREVIAEETDVDTSTLRVDRTELDGDELFVVTVGADGPISDDAVTRICGGFDRIMHEGD